MYFFVDPSNYLWKTATIEIPSGTDRVLFEAIRGGTRTGEAFGDIAIDDITFYRCPKPGRYMCTCSCLQILASIPTSIYIFLLWL